MLRSYTDGDQDQVIEVWYQASLIAHSFLPEAFFEAERQEVVEQWMPASETTVYEDNGQVVGFVSLVGNEVGAIFVHPDHQGRGIGRALMDHARDCRPHLELSVFEANPIGRRFYDAYGFRLVSRQINDVPGQPELRLRLDPSRP